MKNWTNLKFDKSQPRALLPLELAVHQAPGGAGDGQQQQQWHPFLPVCKDNW